MMSFLRNWRETKDQECLLIKGARQVGKTYIVEQFGKSNYESFISIDFIKQPQFKTVFQNSADPDEIFLQMSLLLPDVKFIEGATLIFLDEIQKCPAARTALKYLAIDNRYDIIASGSLLGIQFNEDDSPSIPIGYERAVEMHPLDFEEFLWACSYDEAATKELGEYAKNIQQVPQAVHEKMMRLVREYLAIGGMPAVVQRFVTTQNFAEVHKAQETILASYLDDVANYASATMQVKARECFLSLPRQLAKENTKFQYSVVEKKGTARKFNGSVDWLTAAKMVLSCRAVTTPQFPLVAYSTEDKFRLYANDTGLLMAMYSFDMKEAIVNNTLTGPMKGGLYENLVAGMLAKCGIPLHYWISKDSNNEIEFLVDQNASVVPIEVKSSHGATASLNKLLEREDVQVGYKLIDGNVGKSEKKITLPIYLAPFIF